MPRRARQSSKTGIYHIMLRGINRQRIFEDDQDKDKFLQILNKYKGISKYQVYGYCLMNNHIHLLMKEGEEPIAVAMKRIGASYVYWYNRKYERCGHLFQDRYLSEPVEDDRYLLTVLRYIHQNPLKAKMVKHIEKYKWSSYGEYLGGERIVEAGLIFNILSEDLGRAKSIFVAFMNQSDDSSFLDMNETKKISDKEAKGIIERYGNIKAAEELHKLEKDKRDEVLRKLKQIEGISTRQIARITGISQSVIARA